jgi:DNA-binding NtrC family response regulator
VLPAADTATLSGSETILLIDDEAEVRRAVRRILEHYGYRVLEASSAEQALSIGKLHDREVHLLITDVIMPEMRGPELARRLRALRPELRVLYISGYTGSVPLESSSNVWFLQKPVVPTLLAQSVRKLLDT